MKINTQNIVLIGIIVVTLMSITTNIFLIKKISKYKEDSIKKTLPFVREIDSLQIIIDNNKLLIEDAAKQKEEYAKKIDELKKKYPNAFKPNGEIRNNSKKPIKSNSTISHLRKDLESHRNYHFVSDSIK